MTKFVFFIKKQEWTYSDNAWSSWNTAACKTACIGTELGVCNLAENNAMAAPVVSRCGCSVYAW